MKNYLKIFNFFKKNFPYHKLTPPLLIFILALIFRFLFFRESVYFGFDEARDAYISQSIYLHGDLKLIGPPANFPGLYHGPLFWYIIGPLYLLGNRDIFFVSAVFRILNAFGVFLIYSIGKKFIGKKVGLIAALIYAISFEEIQYAMYVGNPSLAILCWLGLFYGVALIWKDDNWIGLPIIFISISSAVQLELIQIYLFFVLILLLYLMRRKVYTYSLNKWLVSIGLGIFILSAYLISEIKYSFQMTHAFFNLLQKGYSVMQPQDNRYTLYINMFIRIFHDNILSFGSTTLLLILIMITLFFLVRNLTKYSAISFLLIWIFAGFIITFIGGYDAYYVNVGIGLGVILSISLLIGKIYEKSRISALFFILLIFISNLSLVLKFNKDGLIKEIKAQQYMKLTDELIVLDTMYKKADGKGFTVRVTSMPYKIQTVWAYLFNVYGLKSWNYLPFWETELVEGYPGILPKPSKGSTCIRYLIQEPKRGIPEDLLESDIKEEDIFSVVLEEKKVGHFLLQIREAKGDCHNNVAVKI